MRKVILLTGILGVLSSCTQTKVVYVPLSDKQMARELAERGINPCRVLPCGYSGKSEVEIINVPAEDRGDFIIYPHKEAVVVKPIDAVPPTEREKCR